MKPLRESTIEDEWQNHINRSWNLPCDEWEKMMKARASGNEDEAKDLKCTILDYYDNLLQDLKRELIEQGYRRDIVDQRVDQSGSKFGIIKDEYYKALGEATGIDREEDIKKVKHLMTCEKCGFRTDSKVVMHIHACRPQVLKKENL